MRPNRRRQLRSTIVIVACTSAVVVAIAAIASRPRTQPKSASVTAATARDGGADTVTPTLPVGAGNLVVRVRDDDGRPLPARLTFVGIHGTRTPVFTRTDVGVEQPGGVLAYDRAFIIGDASLDIPPGDYDVWFSHGPEWDVATRQIRIGATGSTSVDVTLRHVVDTPGWISGDFHVHAARSWDSRVPMRDRVYQFVADGVDLIVSTDHNAIADYAPIIAELGMTEQLASMRGDEVTTHNWGHFGAFPLPADETTPVAALGRTPATIFADLRRASRDTVIDVHHPRLDHERIGYFHLGKLDPATLRSFRDGFSFDFDALEVLNGYQDPDRRSVNAVLGDWFAFLRRGHRITATGNSDTHHLTLNLGGYPRNYVKVTAGRLDQLDPIAFARAIKAGHSYFTTGPIVDLSVGEQGIGDTVSTHGRPLRLHIVIRAPEWMDVDRVTILVDGNAVIEHAAIGSPPIRFAETVTVPIHRDTFVIVRVDGDGAMAPVIGDYDRFRVFPLAITNPIWVDYDGDGRITPSVGDAAGQR
jgi:hypothetical protein